ncbi:MAG: hypothetical protein EBR81_16525 [Proteobacteria bacterium]|nr:hypothetical protein [Pseudomonadota bacterium]
MFVIEVAGLVMVPVKVGDAKSAFASSEFDNPDIFDCAIAAEALISPSTIVPSTILELVIQDAGRVAVPRTDSVAPEAIVSVVPVANVFVPVVILWLVVVSILLERSVVNPDIFDCAIAAEAFMSPSTIVPSTILELVIQDAGRLAVPRTDSVAPEAIVSVVPVANVFVPAVIL